MLFYTYEVRENDSNMRAKVIMNQLILHQNGCDQSLKSDRGNKQVEGELKCAVKCCVYSYIR